MIKLDKKNIDDIYALTPMQEGMLFFYLKDPNSEAYFEQLSMEIAGTIDNEVFENAWNFVIETNEMLRTVFRWEKVENPLQIILKKHEFRPTYYDFSTDPPKERKNRLQEIKIKDRKEKFDLNHVPFRVILCKIKENHYYLVISNHHILYDGWSTGIILKEFFNAYNDLVQGKELVRPVKTNFKEFVKYTRTQDEKEQERFWRNYLTLDSCCEGAYRPTANPGPVKDTGNSCLEINHKKQAKLDAFLRRYQVTLACVLHTAWAILIGNYHGSDDVIFDTTVSGRNTKIKDIENMVGLLINTLPFRLKIAAEETLSGLIRRVHRHLRERQPFESTSRAVLDECLEKVERKMLFTSLLVIENYPLDKKFLQHQTNMKVQTYCIEEKTRHDMMMIVIPSDSLEISITYNKALFDREMIPELARHFETILDDISGHPHGKIGEIKIWDREARDKFASTLTLRRHSLLAAVEEGAAYTGPRHKLEERLAEVWSGVLRIDKSAIGIDDDFFAFGGHSLKAALLSARIYKEMNIKVPLAEIFKSPTIRELAGYLKGQREVRHRSVRPVDESDYYELSSSQKRFFLIQQMESGGTIYNIHAAVSVRGLFDKSRFEAALRGVIGRHESLRMSIQLVKGQPVQRVHRDIDFRLEYYDLGNRAGVGDWISVEQEKIVNGFIRSFDLCKPPLLRVGLVKWQEDRHTLLVDIHHIIFDGISMNIFIRDLMVFYRGKELAPLRVQYKDFSAWQKNMLKSGGLNQQEKYWLKQLEGDPPVLDFPTDFPRASVQRFMGDRIRLGLEKEICLKVYELAKKTGTTLFMILLAAYNTLLFKYTGQQDILIGSPTGGREHADFEKVIGPFAETLVLRNYPQGNKTWEGFLKEVRSNTLAAFDNSGYPFRELVKKVSSQVELSRNPLFDAMLSVQNQEGLDMQKGGLRFKPHALNRKISKVDFTLEVYETAEGILLILEYSTTLFKQTTMEKMLLHFVNILETVINNPGLRLSEIDAANEKGGAAAGKDEIERSLHADFQF